MYTLNDNLCFGCLEIKLDENHRIIKICDYNKNVSELIKNQYIGALIDFYSGFNTKFSCLPE